MAHTEWVADIRVGVVTVHEKEGDWNCLDGLRSDCIFWRQGTWVEATADRHGHWVVDPKDVDTAHLIAAAPGLLAACETALACVVWDDETDKPRWELDGDTVRLLEATLAKAKGA